MQLLRTQTFTGLQLPKERRDFKAPSLTMTSRCQVVREPPKPSVEKSQHFIFLSQVQRWASFGPKGTSGSGWEKELGVEFMAGVGGGDVDAGGPVPWMKGSQEGPWEEGERD